MQDDGFCVLKPVADLEGCRSRTGAESFAHNAYKGRNYVLVGGKEADFRS